MKNHLIRKHIQLLASFAIIAGVLFSAWGFFVHSFEPIVEYLPIRVSISIIFIIFGLKLFRYESGLYKIEWVFSCLSLLPITYAFYITYVSGLKSTWVAGTVLIIFGVLNFLTYRGPLLFFAIVTLLLGYISLPEVNNPDFMSNWSVMLNYATSIFFGYYSSLLRYKLIVQGTDLASGQDIVLETMTQGVLLIDKEDNVVLHNKIADEIYGNGINNRKVKLLEFLEGWNFQPEDMTILENTKGKSFLHEIRTNKKSFKSIIFSAEKNGVKKWLSVSMVPRITEGPEVNEVLLTYQDISEQKVMQEKIKQQEVSLVVASRLSSLGEMAAGIAHEINNPLALIMARTEMLKRNISRKNISDEETLTQLSEVIGTTFRISKIITSMKSLSRQSEKEEFFEKRFSDILNDVLAISNEKLRLLSIDLHLDIDEDVMVFCDSVQIGQVLMNLLTNSIDAIENLEERWIMIEAKTSGNEFIINFTDSGCGIPTEIEDKVMQPFFTTKDIGKGTGLGLSLTQNILSRHGGKIIIDKNSPNTKFVISMPLTK